MSAKQNDKHSEPLFRKFEANTADAPRREFQSTRVTKRVGGADMVADRPFEEFKAFGESHLYEHRMGQGYGYQCNAFGFVLNVYREWIVRGVEVSNPLTQADIKAVDRKLYWKLFSDAKKNGGMPSWLYLPEDGRETSITAEELLTRIDSCPNNLKMFQKPRLRTEAQIEATRALIAKMRNLSPL